MLENKIAIITGGSEGIGFGFDVAQQYNVKTLDTTLIIDKDGNN